MAKVKFGLKNVYYAVATIAADGTATYATPVRIPGAVNLGMDPQGETTTFRADDIVYWEGLSNNGYSGPLEIALIPRSFEIDVLGMIEDAKGGVAEVVNPTPVHFALLFEFQDDVEGHRVAMYNCTASRASVGGTTKGENIEPQTSTLNLAARAVYNSSLQRDTVKYKLKRSEDATTYDAWFSAVYQPTAAVVSTE